MRQLDGLEAFVAVARCGGFSAAARQLGEPVANVSRKVALLEESLGVLLLVRSTRHVSLTDGGRDYFDTCVRVLDELRSANARITGEYQRPQGELNLSAPVGFGRSHLQPVVHEFLHAFPEVNVNLQLTDRVVSMLDEHIDCAIRISELPDSAMIARKLGEIRMMVCASSRYLKTHGVPRAPQELIGHQCITWTALGPHKAWHFQLQPKAGHPDRLVPINVRLATSTAESAIDAAIDGLGLVLATSYQLAPALHARRLKPVLRSFEIAPVPVSLVYPSKRLIPLKLRAFVDFAAQRLGTRLAEIETFVLRASAPRRTIASRYAASDQPA
jgi:DNA-binding transcriptional LysR family regulator